MSFKLYVYLKLVRNFFGIISDIIPIGKGHEFTSWQTQFHVRAKT